MGRSAHVATEDLTSIKVAYGNCYNGGADTGLGASTTLTGSIEYPAGTFTQLTWSAATSVSVSDVGLATSDAATVSIPSGDTFWVRMYAVSTAGILYNTWQNTTLGEATRVGASGISDQTMSGTITDNSGFSFPPLAILGSTRNPSVVIIGDSISRGSGDTETSSGASAYNGKVGTIARSLGSVPFVNFSADATQGSNFLSDAVVRKQLLGKASHLICAYGTNDLFFGKTAAQTITALASIFATARAGQTVMQATIIPRTSDGGSPSAAFTTLGQQSAVLTEADRISVNSTIKAIGISGQTGYYDLNSIIESSADSGKWLITPSPPYTPDGTHPNLAGYTLVQNSGVVPIPG